MSKPYKTTGCFRFFLFIIILAPLAYLGASYYHGQDGIQNIKNLFSKGIAVFNGSSAREVDKKTPEAVPVPGTNPIELEKEYQISLDLKEKQIEALIKENLMLKQKVQELENQLPKKAPQ
ncbi:MAG: hypothetical protein SH818_00130 [Saprospiraceae bacterium]|nr:hypothetical protein [Saprospiraceae bacterium]